VVHACHPRYVGGIGKNIMVPGKPQAKMRDPIQKVIKAKMIWGVASMEEHLPSKCEILSSIPSTIKKMYRGT
jgi:hypothetical protein